MRWKWLASAGAILLFGLVVLLIRDSLQPIKLITHVAIPPPTNRFPGISPESLSSNWVEEKVVRLGVDAVISPEDYSKIRHIAMKKHHFLRGIESMLIYNSEWVIVRFKADRQGRRAELSIEKDAFGWHLGNENYR